MTHDQFWKLITDSQCDFDLDRRDGNMDLQAQRLGQILSALPLAEVAEFDHVFTQFYFDAYRHDLWAAAYIIGGGCSDDGFMYFRYWLISMGREIYDAAMANPESLAQSASQPGIEVCEFEEFGYIAHRILEKKGAPELSKPSGFCPPREPIGERWEEEDLPKRFPKLWAKFGAANA